MEDETPCRGRRDRDGDGDRDVERGQGALRPRNVNEAAIMEEDPEAACCPS